MIILRDQLLHRAHTNDLPDDWRDFRATRNTVRRMITKDKNNYNAKFFTSNNSKIIWNAAQRLAGKNKGGPPSQLTKDGHVT